MRRVVPILLGVLMAMLAAAFLSSPPEGEAQSQRKPGKRASTLPLIVDLRPMFKEFGLEPRSQGKRNTCSVFVTTWALEFALAKNLGKGVPLSVEYLNWACNQVINNRTEDRGQFFHDLLKGYDRHGVCPEQDMPYADRFDPQLEPSARAIKTAGQVRARGLKVSWINPWRPQPGLTDEHVRQIKETLAKGWPVAAGSGHSRLLVGYRDDSTQPGGGVFITKDSGAGAYTEASYDWVKTNVGDVFWAESTPKRSTKRR